MSSGRFTRSSNNSTKSTTTITIPTPAIVAIIVFRRIFGEDGDVAGLASSSVVTSDTRVTEISSEPLLLVERWRYDLLLQDCHLELKWMTIRVSAGTVTETFFPRVLASMVKF